MPTYKLLVTVRATVTAKNLRRAKAIMRQNPPFSCFGSTDGEYHKTGKVTAVEVESCPTE
jgi:hypothetical protein